MPLEDGQRARWRDMRRKTVPDLNSAARENARSATVQKRVGGLTSASDDDGDSRAAWTRPRRENTTARWRVWRACIRTIRQPINNKASLATANRSRARTFAVDPVTIFSHLFWSTCKIWLSFLILCARIIPTIWETLGPAQPQRNGSAVGHLKTRFSPTCVILPKLVAV